MHTYIHTHIRIHISKHTYAHIHAFVRTYIYNMYIYYINPSTSAARTYHQTVQTIESQRLELDHLKLTVSLEGRKVMEVEERLKNKETLCQSLSEDKASLKSLLTLQEDERRAEGRQFENKIADSMAKIAEENIRLKERSLAQLKESSLKEQQGLRERIQQLEAALMLSERDTEIVRTYVTHQLFY